MNRKHNLGAPEKTFRLIITEDCNAGCPHCFNANMRAGKHMPLDIVHTALSCVDGPSVKLMGGEPTLHPDFLEIIDVCHAVVPAVRLFTNGLRKEILEQAQWHPRDTVTFNFFVANRSLTNQNYLWNKDISRSFHVVINTTTNRERLFVKLRNLAGILHNQPESVRNRSGIVLSLDTQENIFMHKDELQGILHRVVRRLRLWGFRHISRDHHVPLCFWTDTGIREYLNMHLKNNRTIRCLSPHCAGWIGIDGTLRHCNQFPIFLGHLSENGTSTALRSLYRKAKDFKLNLLRKDRECGVCEHLESCLGGCFKAYHLDNESSLHRLKCG